jgi:hypothetical protein
MDYKLYGMWKEEVRAIIIAKFKSCYLRTLKDDAVYVASVIDKCLWGRNTCRKTGPGVILSTVNHK